MKIMKNYINKITNFITTIMIILLTISVISSFQTTFFGKKYNSFFGYSIFEIQTASMAGEMEIGDWILVKITNDVKLNDIITFEQDGSFITHRIIEQYKNTYITKGDSNNSKDTPIEKKQIVGKMIRVMPKFGIVKKTFFNPKVLIILIVTIIVGSSMFEKNNNKSNQLKNKITIKKEREKKQNKFIDNEIKMNDELIEQIDQEIEQRKTELEKINSTEEKKIIEEELENTRVLSKIIVDMNSKTLASISKHLEETTNIEPLPVGEKNKIITPKITTQNFTSKKILLGKNEKNIIKKGIELKENEVIELIKKILNVEILEGELKSITNKFLDIYIESKYINQGELEEDVNLTLYKKNVDKILTMYSESLQKEKNNENYNNKVNDVLHAFKLINKIDYNSDNIDSIIEADKYFSYEDKKNIIKEIKKIKKQFKNNLALFFEKLETKKFQLIIKNIFKGKIFKTNISSNIQFNKLFSKYSIDKTYHNEVIFEDLKELQLKMLSLQTLKDMFEFTYKRKYLISLNDSIFKKEKKLKGFLGNIDDTYSQGKINILIDAKTLLLNFNVISNLNKEGYKFTIEISENDLIDAGNIRKYLCVASNIIIINKEVSKENLLEKIPSELENKVILVDKTIIEGPVIK